MTQLALAYDPGYRSEAAYARVLAAVVDIVARVGLKEAAHALDAQPSVLSHALAGRDRHTVRAEWLPYFLAHDTDGALIRALADCGDWEVSRRVELTPAQRLERIERALASLPESVQAALYRDAGVRR